MDRKPECLWARLQVKLTTTGAECRSASTVTGSPDVAGPCSPTGSLTRSISTGPVTRWTRPVPAACSPCRKHYTPSAVDSASRPWWAASTCCSSPPTRCSFTSWACCRRKGCAGPLTRPVRSLICFYRHKQESDLYYALVCYFFIVLLKKLLSNKITNKVTYLYILLFYIAYKFSL